jgi:hypothetical protein
MRRFYSILTALLISCTLFADAQDNIVSVKSAQQFLLQYVKAEWAIQINTQFKNPYLQEEVAVNMVLKAPSGRELVLPCFYESGKSGEVSNWRARFMAQETGVYSYHFQLWRDYKLVHTTEKQSIQSRRSGKKGILRPGDNWVFRFDNGEPFRAIGENICWESRANDDSKYFKELHEKDKYNYEEMLPALASYGGNYFRTWICSWNLPLDWKSGINNKRYSPSDEYYHPEAIKKLDRLVELSDSLGLYIMLTLGPGTYDEKHGRYQTSTQDFFIDPKARAQYKNRLRFIVARWGYSSAIGAWEFFNEIDNIQFRNPKNPIPSPHIVQWHDEMASYLKQIDPFGHLVTTSISHRDLPGLNSIGAIDFNQKHIYNNNRALPTTIVNYTRDFNKPYVIGEYGFEWDWQKNFNDFADGMDSDFKRGLWYGLFSPTPILPMSWWWEYFDDRKTDRYFKNVRIIHEEMMKAGKGRYESVSVTAAGSVEVFAVRCGKKLFVYAYNAGKAQVQTKIMVESSSARKKGRAYDCEKASFSDFRNIQVNGGNVTLNDVSLDAGMDKVFIIER